MERDGSMEVERSIRTSMDRNFREYFLERVRGIGAHAERSAAQVNIFAAQAERIATHLSRNADQAQANRITAQVDRIAAQARRIPAQVNRFEDQARRIAAQIDITYVRRTVDELQGIETQLQRNITELERITAVTELFFDFDNNDEHRIYFESEFKSRVCDCEFFSEDLRNFYNEMISENNESSKWKAFENFTKKYASNYHRMFSTDSSVTPNNCSLKFFSVLLSRIELFLNSGIALSTILKTEMRTMCLENFENISSCVLDDLEDNLLKESGSSDSREASVILAALRNQSNFVNSLVKFGFISSRRNDSSGFERENYCMICSFIWTWTGSSQFQHVKRIMDLTEKAFSYYKNGEISVRIFWSTVAVRAIQLSLRKEHSLANKFVHYLRAYFAATTDSFLTTFEVRSLLFACFTVLEKSDLFDTYCEEFQKLMPDCPLEIEPRKLVDLARCQVRANLNNCDLPLPSAVEKLGLPNTLKNFVLGNITDISRKRKYDSPQKGVTTSKLGKLLFE